MIRRAPEIRPGEMHRTERLLAVARIVVAVGIALLLCLDQAFHPGLFSAGYIGMVGLYVLHSFLGLWLLHRRERSASFRAVIHVADLCWPAVLSVLAPTSDHPLWLLWFFAINAAAYRWGPWPLAATIAVALLFVFGGPNDSRDVALQAAYLLLFSIPVAYLAESVRQRRADRQVLAQLASVPSMKLGVARTVGEIMVQLRALLEARDVLIAVNEIAEGRSYLWEAPTSDEASHGAAIVRGFEPSDEQCYLFAAPARSWDTDRSQPRKRRTVTWDARGRRQLSMLEPDMARFKIRHPHERLIVIGFSFKKEWRGRIFVLDPAPTRDRDGRLRFVEAAVRQLSPALYDTYLLWRLRSRSRALERARVARELHDGITQSLIAAQMKLDIARRKVAAVPVEAISDMESVERILAQEICNLRDSMRALKTTLVAPNRLVSVMEEDVEHFAHETGIGTRLVTRDVESIRLSPRTCTELARILREALANVRRHSGAQHVTVRFGVAENQYYLIVEDDGRGIARASRPGGLALVTPEHAANAHDSQGFNAIPGSARQPAHDGLWRQCPPPPSIAESVAAVAGTVTVDSAPGAGLRLEVRIRSVDATRSLTQDARPDLLAGILPEKRTMARARLAERLRPSRLAQRLAER